MGRALATMPQSAAYDLCDKREEKIGCEAAGGGVGSGVGSNGGAGMRFVSVGSTVGVVVGEERGAVSETPARGPAQVLV